MKKLILCHGNAHTPARFWKWTVCYENEYTEADKKAGVVESQCRKYLTKEQLNFLESK